MIREYPVLLLLIAILVCCCTYFLTKKFGRYFDSGEKPYLTRNLYIVGPTLLIFAVLLISNLGLALMGLGGLYVQFFKKNDFESIASKVEAIDSKISKSNVNNSEKKSLLMKKEEFIKEIENGSLMNAVKVDLDVNYDDLYGFENHSKDLLIVVNRSLDRKNGND